MYSPRGPVCDVHNSELISSMIDEVKKLAKKKNAYILKMDPDVLASDEDFLKITQECGFKIPKQNKNFEGIQPRFVFRINNIKGKSEDEIFNSFESKTRYNIRLAMKKNVTVKLGSKEDLAIFHDIMLETGVRDSFVTRSLEYFERMYDAMAPNYLRLYMAYLDNKPIAGTIATLYGNKCWYLYGASSNAHRNVMPNYLLQWEMIKWALSSGCDIYDFRGVSGDLDENSPLYGLYRFKKGFNGDFTEFVGEMNFVFNPFVKFIIEKGSVLYKSLRSKIFLFKNRKKVNSHEKIED
jgi:lipid II:glycine glycyltransferase (peptidoglycan interpeptide bridge formation enzyme)